MADLYKGPTLADGDQPDDDYTVSFKSNGRWLGNIARALGGGVSGTVSALLSSIDTRITSTNTKLDTLHTDLTTVDGHVDGLETLVTSSNTKLDTLHTDLGTINGNVDGLETLIGTTNSTLSTISGNVDGLETNTNAAAHDDTYTGTRLMPVSLANIARLLAGSVSGTLRGAADDTYDTAARNLSVTAGNVARALYNSTSSKTIAQQLSSGTSHINDVGKMLGATTLTQVTASGNVTSGPARLFSITCYTVGTTTDPLFSNGSGGVGIWKRAIADLKVGDVYAFPGGVYCSGGIYALTFPTGGVYNISYSV